MVGIVALCLLTHVHRIISTTLRRQRAQSLWCQQFTSTDVKHASLLLLAERRIVECHCKHHIRTHTPVNHIAIYIVVEITIFVEECIYERLSSHVGKVVEFGCLVGTSVVSCNRGTELKSIIPQCIKLHNVSRTRYNRTSVGCRVHPCHCLVATVGIKQTVVVEAQIGMIAIYNIMYNVLKKFSIHLRALVSTCRLGILLDCPYCPQGHVGLLHLVDLCSDGLSFHKLPQSLLGSLHHQLKIVLLVDGESKTRQGDERVASAALKPRITGKKITVVILLALVELVGSIHQAMEEVVAR